MNMKKITQLQKIQKKSQINLNYNNTLTIERTGEQTTRITNDNINFVSQLPMILQEHNEVGNFAHDIFEVTINTLEHKTKELIKSKPLKEYSFKL